MLAADLLPSATGCWKAFAAVLLSSLDLDLYAGNAVRFVSVHFAGLPGTGEGPNNYRRASVPLDIADSDGERRR